MNLLVKIPDKLASRLSANGPDLERQVLEALVAEGYRGGYVTIGDLREALGLKMPDEVAGFLKLHRLDESRSVDEGGALKGRDRQVRLVEDLPEDIIDQIARTEMDPGHDHLNDLLKDWTP